MASYQDIESRLRTVESKIEFMMRQFKITKQEILPTLDSQGRPIVKVETKDLLDLYHEVKNGSVELVEVKNGTDTAGN